MLLDLERPAPSRIGDDLAPSFEIRSFGLASAQGTAGEIRARRSLEPAKPVPWPAKRWTTSRHCRPAEAGRGLEGAGRFNALVRQALEECFPSGYPPKPPAIVVASCNGGARDGAGDEGWHRAFESGALLRGTPWQDEPVPVLSASCASGLQAIYVAELLLSAGQEQVVVLAADVLSDECQDNFESLHVLAPEPHAPWRRPAEGFVTGEAAVALLLEPPAGESPLPAISAVSLDHDLHTGDGLSRAVSAHARCAPELVVGQGTGPDEVDAVELEALSRWIPASVPLASPLLSFGHTLGASGTLSLALAAIALRERRPIALAEGGGPAAILGRAVEHEMHGDRILIVCRALTGASAAVVIGSSVHLRTGPRRRRPGSERAPAVPAPPSCLLPVTKRIAASLGGLRPPRLPDLLVVRLEAPLRPTPSVVLGGRLLPSAVLEITPGFLLSLVVRTWGYTGPSLCLVGDEGCDAAVASWLEAARASGLTTGLLTVAGSGDERSLRWSARA